MKALPASILVTAALISPASLARGAPKSPAQQSIAQLNRALSAVAATVSQSGQASQLIDPDHGDEHANPSAILRVCSKDTPAAQRAAICPVGVSPD